MFTMNIGGRQEEDLIWDPTQEVVQVKEEPRWLSCRRKKLQCMEVADWAKEGPKILEIESFTDFIDPKLLIRILHKKSVFNYWERKKLVSGVRRSNPFEMIGKGIFQNRAAMKMANIDKVFSFMFTNPVDDSNNPIISENDLLYFADVCSGPGGFSEYIFYRKQWQAKGIGFTLRESDDFKLDKFLAGTPESFEPYYGVKGDGNIYDPENIASLTSFVMAKTENRGVHFMMADGGFSVAGQENIQELLSKRLYLCQCLVALCIVRTGGHFVCKLFDLFSPFSAGIVYLMYRSFESISIHKPNSSRPANSERYIICKGKRSDCSAIKDYMFHLNVRLNFLSEHNTMTDINEIVPMSELTSDSKFFNYLVKSNNTLGERQFLNLVKVIHYSRNGIITEPKQNDIRGQCLQYWGVEEVIEQLDILPPSRMARQILNLKNFQFVATPAKEIKSEVSLEKVFPSVLDWTCIPIGKENKCNVYVGCTRAVYELTNKGRSWIKIDTNVKLSPGTIVYGEIIDEVSGKDKAQTRKKVFHIIDAFSLGKKVITNRSYNTRIKLCKLYVRALHKSWETDISTQFSFPMPIRVNNYYRLTHFNEMIKGLKLCKGKNKNVETLFDVKDDTTSEPSYSENYCFPIRGFLFYKLTKNPWLVDFSKTRQMIYFFDTARGISQFKEPSDINSSSIDCFRNRIVWTWDNGVGLLHEPQEENVLMHFTTHFNNFIDGAKNKMKMK